MSENPGVGSVSVEVAFGTSERQVVKKLEVAATATVLDVVLQADLNFDFPDFDLSGFIWPFRPYRPVRRNGQQHLTTYR